MFLSLPYLYYYHTTQYTCTHVCSMYTVLLIHVHVHTQYMYILNFVIAFVARCIREESEHE